MPELLSLIFQIALPVLHGFFFGLGFVLAIKLIRRLR